MKKALRRLRSLDDAKGRYDSARANLAALTKTYELIRQGPRQEQIEDGPFRSWPCQGGDGIRKTILDSAEIRVPGDGTILERNVEQGEMVTTSFVGDRGAKSFVVTLADLSDLQVELDINQNDFNRIAAEQPCTVVTDAYPDRVLQLPRGRNLSGGQPAKGHDSSEGEGWSQPDEFIRPDMNARVTFLETAAAQSLQARAKDSSPFRNERCWSANPERPVYVVADGKVQTKPIIIQKEVGGDVFVSAGLIGNESIIVGEQLSQLKVGDRVQVLGSRSPK